MPLYTRPLAIPTVYTPPTGGYLWSPHVQSTAAATPTSGLISWVPFDVGPRPFTIQSLNVYVTVALSGGTTTWAMGLYPDDGTGGQPLLTAQIASSTAVVLTATGARPMTLSMTLAPGRYWGAALYVQTAAPTTVPTLPCITNNSPQMWLPSSGISLGTVVRCLSLATQTVLPTTAQTLVPASNTTTPAMFLRAA